MSKNVSHLTIIIYITVQEIVGVNVLENMGSIYKIIQIKKHPNYLIN